MTIVIPPSDHDSDGFAAVGGIGLNKEGIVTHALKQFFHRARPSDLIHHSYSFPSGHATSAYFVYAFLLFAIVPAVAACLQPSGGEGVEQTGSRQSGQTSLHRLLEWCKVPRNAVLLVVTCASVTQAGRVLADVHYVSDTLAGACLGSVGAGVSIGMLQVGHRMAASTHRRWINLRSR
jgi:membrane-associated phospholipid phosphatase